MEIETRFGYGEIKNALCPEALIKRRMKNNGVPILPYVSGFGVSHGHIQEFDDETTSERVFIWKDS